MSRRPLVLALALAFASLTAPAFEHDDPAHDDDAVEADIDAAVDAAIADRANRRAHADDDRREGASRSRVMGGLHADEGEVVGDYETVNGGISIDDKARAGKLTTVNGGIDMGDDTTAASATTVN